MIILGGSGRFIVIVFVITRRPLSHFLSGDRLLAAAHVEPPGSREMAARARVPSLSRVPCPPRRVRTGAFGPVRSNVLVVCCVTSLSHL